MEWCVVLLLLMGLWCITPYGLMVYYSLWAYGVLLLMGLWCITPYGLRVYSVFIIFTYIFPSVSLVILCIHCVTVLPTVFHHLLTVQ